MTDSYISNYDAIENSGKNWIAFCGRSGSGKSTQAYMIIDNLLSRQRSVYAKCFQYQDVVRDLTAFRFDYERFLDKLDEILSADLVLLDDFLDVIPKPESFEEQVALTIIKRRYIQRKPLILTTELTPRAFQNSIPRHGEAMLGRIVEMCSGRIMVASSDRPNYRINVS